MSSRTGSTLVSYLRRFRLVGIVAMALVLFGATAAVAVLWGAGAQGFGSGGDGASSLTAAATTPVPGDMFVETTATGGSDITGDGSQAAPFATVPKAMTQIGSGRTIRVGPGEFECVTLTVKDNVAIEGAGSDLTTLTAHGKGRVLIYSLTGVGESLTNVAITGGAGNAYGGGLYIRGSSPTVTSCAISGNATTGNGGGAWCQSGAAPVFTDCTISNNTAAFYGGAVYSMTGAAPRFVSCVMASNSAIDGGAIDGVDASRISVVSSRVEANSATSRGGAVYVEDGTLVTITGSTLQANTSSNLGGAICIKGSAGVDVSTSGIISNSSVSRGAGIYMEDAGSVATITASTVSSNTAGSAGGAVFAQTGSRLTISGCDLVANSGSWGGAVYVENVGTVATIATSSVNSNRASGYGGGIFAQGSAILDITSCEIASNSSGNVAGGIYLEDLGTGAAIKASTIASNTASGAGGGVTVRFSAEATVTNSVVWGNAASDNQQVSTTGVTASYSDIGGGLAGTGNINADPLFRDPATGDFRLRGGSPAIDTATSTASPAQDLLGMARPQGLGVDMGAYEYVFTPRTARADSVVTSEDVPAVFNVLTNDDPSESTVAKRTAVQYSAVSTGTLASAASGDVTYTPPANWSGTASFTYVADYETTQSAPVTVTIRVDAVNDAPRAVSDGELAILQRFEATTPPYETWGFGAGVAMQGDTAVICSAAANPGLPDGLHVYQRTGGVWRETQTFPSTPAYGLVLDGDTFVVGQRNGEHALVYHRDATGTWSLQQSLINNNNIDGDEFGFSVDLEGDTLVVGAPRHNRFVRVNGVQVNPPGSAFVFTRSNGVWTQRAELTASTEATSNDRIGQAVAIDGDTIMTTGWFSGGWAFTRTGADWSSYTQARLPLGDARCMSDTGHGIKIQGDTAIVGTTGGPFILNRTASGWVLTQKLQPLAEGGFSVDLDGDWGVAGTYGWGGYVIRRTDAGWVKVRDIPIIDGGMAFGWNGDLSDGTLLMGDPYSTNSDHRRGAAVFIDAVLYTATEDTPLIVDTHRGVLHNDTDVENDPLTASLLDTSDLHGSLALDPGGSFTYTPDANFNGTAKATYRVSDGNGGSSTATITITVDAVNDVPVAVDDAATINEDAVATLNVLDNDTDLDTAHASLVATAFSVPTTGTIDTLPSGEVTYTPPADWNGHASFTYQVYDGHDFSASATVTITVNPINDPPIGRTDERTCPQDGFEAFNVLGNDTDVDTAHGSLVATAFSQPTTGTLTTLPSGDVTYTPSPHYLGTVTFTYQVSDGEHVSAPVTITIIVTRRRVTRIGGADRFEAAANIARSGWDPDGTKTWPGVGYVIIANGESGKEADPLCSAGLAGVYDAPILLVSSKGVPDYTRTALTEIAANNPGVRIIIVGGKASVPDARWQDIQNIQGVDPTYDRISGADRYAVSAGIADRIVLIKGADAVPGVILIAADNADAFYDGLAVGPIAYANAMPLVAVRKGYIPSFTQETLGGALEGKPRYAASGAAYISATTAAGSARLTTSSDRYTAAAQIGNAALAHHWLIEDQVGIAAKLPDALTGGAFLGKHGGVLLFTDSDDSMQPATVNFLTAHEGQIVYGWIFGGPGTVTIAQEATLRSLLK